MLLHKTILIVIQKDILQITTRSDSHGVVTSVNGKICVPKDIVILVEDVTRLVALFSDRRIEYCNMVINRETNILVKMVRL